MAGAVPRVVLDTNVWLDLLVFADPRASALHAALRAGAVIAVSNGPCRGEWLRVLAYPQWALTAAQQERVTGDYDTLSHAIHHAPSGPTTGPLAPLPRCGDPDDQKFLELAQASGARWLISRDNLLLKLTRRTRRDHGFDIMTPECWSL